MNMVKAMLFGVLLYAAGVATGHMLSTKRTVERGVIACFEDGTADMRNITISGPGFDKLPMKELLGRVLRVLCEEHNA